MMLMTISAKQYNKRIEANTNSIFFRYSTEADALVSYTNKDNNPLFDSNELFVFIVKYSETYFEYIVQTTGSLVTAGA